MTIKKTIKSNRAFNIINAILIIAVLLLLICYIILANYAFSSEYKLGVMKRQVDALSLEVTGLQRDLDKYSDIVSLRSYAIQKGLVEARDAYIVSKESDFALSE